MPRTRTAVLAVGVLGLATTAVVMTVDALHFAYRSPALHLTLQTSEALIALIAAFLVSGRFWRRLRGDDLLLYAALLTLALGNLVFAAVPSLFAIDDSAFSTWAALVARLAGAVLLAAAALTRGQRVYHPRRRHVQTQAGVLGLMATVAAAVLVLEPSLPTGIEVHPAESGRPRLETNVLVLGSQLTALLLYAAAAYGFLRKAERTGDPMLSWLAAAATLSAVARVNYFIYPSLFTEWVYVGDAFRLAFYVVIIVAAAAEVEHWRRRALTATLEERRRLARDLHDGLAQDLASVRRNLLWLDAADPNVQRAQASADRALAQARQAMHAILARPGDSLADTIAGSVTIAAERDGAELVLDLDSSVRVGPEEAEALAMIASEAVTNAIRHGGVARVRVELRDERPLLLRISDAGRGFAAPPSGESGSGGRGLIGMRQRAEAIGGSLEVTSAVGNGTLVEVRL